MKKNVLALSIATLIGGLGLAGGAAAAVITPTGATTTDLAINKDGLGHILLVPYYNASEGMSTIINLVNSDTVNGKALKVRFRGANNSDDVFDFTLFLSPGDVWSGAVVNNGGTAALNTKDNSCVLPDNAGINSGTSVNFATNRLGAAGGKGTLEGYVEVLTMADVPPNFTGSTTAVSNPLYIATKHNSSGNVNCFTGTTGADLLNKLATTPTNLTEAQNIGLTYPTGKLFGNWTIINTSNVSSWGGEATAVAVVDTAASGTENRGNIVFWPQRNATVDGVDTTSATTIATTTAGLTADPLLNTGLVTIRQYDLPDLSTPYTAAAGTVAADQADSLTKALAVTSVTNEYITSSSVVGSTDWVFSMPTRRYHVALDYTSTVTDTAALVERPTVLSDYFVKTAASGRNVNVKVDSTAARKALAGERSICVELPTGSLTYFDRSERQPAADVPPFVISPNEPTVSPALKFCGEASVLSINSDTSKVLGATVGLNGVTLNTGFNEGWASIATANTQGGSPMGFPILGAAFQKYLNMNGTNILGNFGSVYPHRYTRPAP